MNTGLEAAVTFPFPAETSTDAALMGQVRDGDVTRLGEIFERHHRPLFNFFTRLVRNRTAAEDLVQEVFVRILKYRHTYKPGAEFVPWLYTLARNAAADLYRAMPKEVPESPQRPEPVANAPHPVERLQRAESVRTLERALGRLSADQRETLLLARFSGLDYESIGGLLGISQGAVKGRVHRAMGDLKRAYRREEKETR